MLLVSGVPRSLERFSSPPRTSAETVRHRRNGQKLQRALPLVWCAKRSGAFSLRVFSLRGQIFSVQYDQFGQQGFLDFWREHTAPLCFYVLSKCVPGFLLSLYLVGNNF